MTICSEPAGKWAIWADGTRAHQRVDLLTDKVAGLEALKEAAARDAKQSSPRLEQELKELRGWHSELTERKQSLEGKHAWWESLKGDEVEDTWGELHRIEVGVDVYEPMAALLQLAEEHIEQDLPKKRADQIRQQLSSQRGQPDGSDSPPSRPSVKLTMPPLCPPPLCWRSFSSSVRWAAFWVRW